VGKEEVKKEGLSHRLTHIDTDQRRWERGGGLGNGDFHHEVHEDHEGEKRMLKLRAKVKINGKWRGPIKSGIEIKS
jgi:hypothetical protein